ncbi:MAG TPA: response regulator [Thermomicrobiales bacterium]|nr:response regulator [Thermomicrobiales bacterium]
MSAGAGNAIHRPVTSSNGTATAAESDEAEPVTTGDAQPATDAGVVESESGRGHVLIVEDDLIIADLIDQILRFESFHVSHVIDGRSAVNYATTHHPDLILMDLMLPVMSGMDASRMIKLHPDCHVSQIPIVAMSAGVNLRATAHGLSVEGVLAKPFDIDELLATVDIHIRRP